MSTAARRANLVDLSSSHGDQAKHEQLKAQLERARYLLPAGDPTGGSVEAKIGTHLKDFKDVIPMPVHQPLEYAPSESMWALKEWDGHVTEIQMEFFVALLASVGSKSGETERLEYPLEALRASDRRDLSVGSIFRLSAGYTRKSTGRISQTLELYFRPKSALSKSKAKETAGRIKAMFGRSVRAPQFDATR